MPGSVAADTLGDLTGLGLSPATWPEALGGLTGPFTPTAFVSVAALDRMAPSDGAAAAAHELLHAMGLGHSSDPGNLMAVGGHVGAGRLTGLQRARASMQGSAQAQIGP